MDYRDYKAMNKDTQCNSSLGVVIWRFSGVRTIDNKKVFGEYPFTYQEGRECYNMASFWRHVQSGYIDPRTVVNAI